MLTGTAVFWAILRLAVVLAAIGALCGCIIVAGMAIGVLCPPRMRDGRAMFFLRRLSPSDLNLHYRDMNFTVRDQRSGRPLRIAGWWIEAAVPSDRTVILVHGYSDAKVGGIAWAPLFHSLNFNVLAIDQRAHGESQGRFSTAGFYERHDLSQVIDHLKADEPDRSRKLVLFGVSLGAAAVAAAAALRGDIAAVVLDCPFVDFPRAVLSHSDSLPIPGRFFQSRAIQLAQILSGADWMKVRPVDLIRTLRCPIWVVQSTDDPFVPPDDQDAIAAAVAARGSDLPPAQFWRVADSFHVLAMADHPAEYRRRLVEFLDEAFAAPTQSPATLLPGPQPQTIHP